MVNDFEEFAMQFRRRTAARLLEFEKNLDKAQRAVEQSAMHSAAQRHAPAAGPQRRAGGRGNRQVKGVLRRD